MRALRRKVARHQRRRALPFRRDRRLRDPRPIPTTALLHHPNRRGLLPGKLSVSSRFPWLPFIGSTAPSLFANFTTEGTTNHYWYLGAKYSSFAAWLTAISGTFSRASTAYYTNSSGNLAQASSGQIRFDYDPISLQPKGLLLEGTSTNLLLQSNTFSNASWTLSSATVAQNVTGPDGVSNSAWTLAGDGTASSHFMFQSITGSNATVYTASFYAKQGTNRYIQFLDNGLSPSGNGYINIDLQTGVTGGTFGSYSSVNVTNVDNGWYRISITATSTSTAITFALDIPQSLTDTRAQTFTTSNSVLIFGAQIEQAPFASSYIPTTSSTATRAADSLTATPISSWYNATNGVLYAAAEPIYEDASASGSVAISDSVGNNGVGFFNRPVTLATVASGGANVAVFSSTDAGQVGTVIGTLSRTAISATANSFIYVKDGGTADTDSSGAMPVSPDRLFIGPNTDTYTGGGTIAPYHINQIGYWPTTATAAQLQTLTT